jgi:hypothetical protein
MYLFKELGSKNSKDIQKFPSNLHVSLITSGKKYGLKKLKSNDLIRNGIGEQYRI